MSVRQNPALEPSERRTGAYLINTSRARYAPTPGRIARRRVLVTVTKWFLPLLALVLLASIVIWPEIGALTNGARLAMKGLSGHIEGGSLLDARYNGIDQKGRPYTVTAATARQTAPDHVVLTLPKGDITLENGTWLMLTALNGTFVQSLNQLDLVNNVTLYRDDGTVMHTASASIDLKAGVAAGSQPIHVEGPFGVLDAEGFAVMDKGAAIDFTGPAHVILNGAGH